MLVQNLWGFPAGASVGDARGADSNPESGRSPGTGNGNPLQYSCLESSMDKSNLAGYSPWACKKLDMTEQLSIPVHRSFYLSFPNLYKI